MKKLSLILIILIAITASFYGMIKFTGLDPDTFFENLPSVKETPQEINYESISALYDSLESLNFVIRVETDERRLKNLKDLQKNLWEKIFSSQKAISKNNNNNNNNTQNASGDVNDLVDSLVKGISVTAAVLIAAIIFLLIKVNRKKKDVDRVTERLRALQSEPPPPLPLGGFDATLIPRRVQNPLPQVQPQQSVTQTQTTVTATGQQPNLRPTAKQRVTEAVQRMMDALNAVRSTQKIKQATIKQPTLATGKQTRTQIRVASKNTFQDKTVLSHSQDETNFDRRSREKKQILDYARQGHTPSEIARYLSLPREQVETVLRMAREMGE